MRIAAVFFDLDGTLIDTAGDLGAALNRLRSEHGLPALPQAQLRSLVSRGGRALLEAGFPDLTVRAREALMPGLLQRYGENIAEFSALFPGMDAVLRELEAAGVPWGVVTNKPEGLAARLLEALRLADRCAVLVGGDTLPVRKPDPAPLLLAARLVNVEPVDCVYIGDDLRDVEAAHNAGMRSIAAAWGYGGAADVVAAWDAAHVAERPADLLRLGLPARLR